MNKHTISIHRTFNAPITLVWEAWTQAEHIAEWWSPKGVKTKVVEHDIIHPTEAYKIQQEKMGIMNGWGSVFNRLDELLKELETK